MPSPISPLINLQKNISSNKFLEAQSEIQRNAQENKLMGLYLMKSIGQPKAQSLELKIKVNVVHAGPSQPPDP